MPPNEDLGGFLRNVMRFGFDFFDYVKFWAVLVKVIS